MIRDPSDGSVREPQKEDGSKLSSPPIAGSGPVIDAATSGLQTGSEKPENLARLEESRKWLRDYHAKKAEKPE